MGMTEVTNKYVVRAGTSTLRGDDFHAVCVALIERGYNVAQAKEVSRGVIEIPHSSNRKPAVLQAALDDKPEEQVEPAWVPEPIAVPQIVVGLQTRECGSMHSEGVFCRIPVLFETPECGCADRVYEHDGPHEATDDYGVSHRWTEVLMIQDAEFDCYSDRTDPSGQEWAS